MPSRLNAFDKTLVGDDTTVVDSNTCVADADLYYFDSNGLTPLMHVANLGHAGVVKALLEAGAPWNALSPSNLSTGGFAMESGH
ncbi:hypothetical protein SLA2020_196540 [Shorea laevis]